MNAIIFYEFNQLLTGSTINAIEYFLAAYEHNRDLKLVFINATNKTIKKFVDIVEDRYDLNGIENYKDNIIRIPKSKIVKFNFDTVLVLDYNTIGKTKGILRANKIIVIAEKYQEKYFYDPLKYNVTIYGEMPFQYKDVDYRMKCLFNRYKPLQNVEVGTFINSPRNDEDLSWVEYRLNVPHPIIYKSKTDHKKKLFEHFTTYLYYHANTWFDPHPRLFLECEYYGKDIVYLNPFKIMDGSFYRYQDVSEKGLVNRTLNKYDEIIGELI